MSCNSIQKYYASRCSVLSCCVIPRIGYVFVRKIALGAFLRLYFFRVLFSSTEKKRLRTSDGTFDAGSCEKLLDIEYSLSRKLRELTFEPPIRYVYDPLEYAKDIHLKFIRKYCNIDGEKILFLGMNPGPWGMCQTGVPFGESKVVNEWFGISGTVNRPETEHPSKKISGLNCQRSEVSGKKFWGLMKGLCGSPENFFKHCLVYNICPLAFLSESGTNLTPVEIKAKNSRKLNELCDDALGDVIIQLGIKLVIAIGKFAEKRALIAIKSKNIDNVKVSSIPHPSPRNAKNFSNWESITTSKLRKLGVYNLLTGID